MMIGWTFLYDEKKSILLRKLHDEVLEIHRIHPLAQRALQKDCLKCTIQMNLVRHGSLRLQSSTLIRVLGQPIKTYGYKVKGASS